MGLSICGRKLLLPMAKASFQVGAGAGLFPYGLVFHGFHSPWSDIQKRKMGLVIFCINPRKFSSN